MRITQHYSVINVRIRIELSVIFICLFGVKLSDDDVKKIETCRSTSELHVKVCILILVRLFVLTFVFKCVSINFPTPALFSPVPSRNQSSKICNIISVNINKSSGT